MRVRVAPVLDRGKSGLRRQNRSGEEKTMRLFSKLLPNEPEILAARSRSRNLVLDLIRGDEAGGGEEGFCPVAGPPRARTTRCYLYR